MFHHSIFNIHFAKPRRISLVKPGKGKRSRLVISNTLNAQHHQLERALARLLTRLCLLESNGLSLTHDQRRILAKIRHYLRCGDLCLAINSVDLVAQMLGSQFSGHPSYSGPLILAGCEFHGFIPSCSPGTLLISLRNSGWPLKPLFEHDIKSAFEIADLSILRKSLLKQRIPFSVSLAQAVMSSDLVIRRASLSSKTFNDSEFAVASAKQFPDIMPGLKFFTNHELIQGSPLSPILFILYIAATSLGEGHSGQTLRVYGDNVYSCLPNPPEWSNCQWKDAVFLGHEGKTLGLEYKLSSNGRLIVSHPSKSYSMGIQKKLDQHWSSSLDNGKESNE